MSRLLRGTVVVLVFGAAIYISHRAGLPEKADGSPDKLPSAALGWRLLFHVVRATALLGAISLVLLIGWRATSGDFPIKFGQVEYAAREAAGEAARAAASQERRIRILEVLQGIRDPVEIEDDEAGETKLTL